MHSCTCSLPDTGLEYNFIDVNFASEHARSLAERVLPQKEERGLSALVGAALASKELADKIGAGVIGLGLKQLLNTMRLVALQMVEDLTEAMVKFDYTYMCPTTCIPRYIVLISKTTCKKFQPAAIGWRTTRANGRILRRDEKQDRQRPCSSHARLEGRRVPPKIVLGGTPSHYSPFGLVPIILKAELPLFRTGPFKNSAVSPRAKAPS